LRWLATAVSLATSMLMIAWAKEWMPATLSFSLAAWESLRLDRLIRYPISRVVRAITTSRMMMGTRRLLRHFMESSPIEGDEAVALDDLSPLS
jgi:hypothetical protein